MRVLTKLLPSLLLMLCILACSGNSNDEESLPVVEECKWSFSNGPQTDGWSDSGTTSYYKENETTELKSWIQFAFGGTSDEDKCIGATHYYIYSTVEGAKMHYSDVCNENLETNPKIDSNMLSFNEPEYIDKTKKELKALLNVEEPEPEVKVDTTQIGGRWVFVRSTTDEGYRTSTSERRDKKWESYVFDATNKTFSKEVSDDQGKYWYMQFDDFYGTYSLYLYNQGSALEQGILITKYVTGGTMKYSILKLNSKEMTTYHESLMAGGVTYKTTSYYEKQQ